MRKTFVVAFFSVLFLLGEAQPIPNPNVGIGISNPQRAKLELNGAVGSTAAIFGTESSGISIQRNLPALGFNQYYNGANKYIANGFAAVQSFDPATGNMVFDMFPAGVKNAGATPFNRALVIGSNGNVGIKTNPANASLYVIKAGNFDGSAVFGGSHYNSHFHYGTNEDTYIRAGLAYSNIYINDVFNGKVIIGSGTSYVGINTATPVFPLEVRQAASTGMILVEPNNAFNNWEQVVGLYNGGPQSSLKLIYNGTLKCFFRPTDGAFITSSDKRLKTNIRPLSLVLDKLIKLRPVEYEIMHNNPNHQKSVGFIAQEVKELFPGLVSSSGSTVIEGNTINNFHTLNYDAFKTISIKAVQEEQALIIDLQRRQTDIVNRLDAIEKKLVIKN